MACAQGRRATRLRYAPKVIALFILKHFPTLLLIRNLNFYFNCAKTRSLNHGCARIQGHFVGLAVDFL